MHDVCKEYMSAAAISAGFPQDTLISHNEIFHIPYSGMHLGYGWVGIPTSAIKNFDVTHNYIHDLFYTKLYDGGGIYTIDLPVHRKKTRTCWHITTLPT